MNPRLAAILENFKLPGKLLEVLPHKVGHIHDTYIATFRRSGEETQRYLVQRVNDHVFERPEALMANIQRVTAHLREKIAAAGGDPQRETLSLIPTQRGRSFYKNAQGEYWRAYTFIENTQSYEKIRDLDHVYQVARAFGRFQGLLRDFPPSALHETIPDFHHTPKRLAAFLAVAAKDPHNRAQFAQEEMAFVKERGEEAPILTDLIAHGDLPLRVTHNDTKFNNVLIDDATGEGVCVVDLDTVMPGLALYDFGDAVRSGANPAPESERDLSKVGIDLARFEAFVHGYLDAAGDFLTPLEVSLLPFSAKLMTFECGVRFLTDYLAGDVYFKTDRENHNLDRARTQFKMVADMERKFEEMGEIVGGY